MEETWPGSEEYQHCVSSRVGGAYGSGVLGEMREDRTGVSCGDEDSGRPSSRCWIM